MTGLGGLSVWSILHTKRPVKPKFFKAFIRMFFRFWILRYGIVSAIPHFLSK